MSEPVTVELIHERTSPWADRARVKIASADELVDGLSSLAAQTIAAHLFASFNDLTIDKVRLDVGVFDDSLGGLVWERGLRCELGVFGWELDSPLERHAVNHRIITLERFTASVDPLTVLAVPDENGGLHTYATQFGTRRSTADPAFGIRLEMAPDLFDPHKYLLPLDPSPPLLPYMLLDKDAHLQILGSEAAVHRALKSNRFGTPEQAEAFLELMIVAWRDRFGR